MRCSIKRSDAAGHWGIMRQREVWESVASPWRDYRTKPFPGVAEFLKNKKGAVLDMGCGSGRNFIKGNFKLVGTDFSGSMLRFAKQRAGEKRIAFSAVLGDISALPLKDNSFDSALFVAALHCLKKRERKNSLKELLRVLKPQAEALITAWNRGQPRFHGKKEGHIPWAHKGRKYMRYYYLYDVNELEAELKSAGFVIERLSGSEEKAFNIFPRNIIAIVKKV